MENENSIEISNIDIKKLIYTIRGKQVMLDSDVAMLYHYETKKINQTVRRNVKRFPENFCFKLTDEETNYLRSQIVTLNKKINNGNVTRKYLPNVFTEQGIAMLSGLLKNEITVQVSINIMNAFVEMKRNIERFPEDFCFQLTLEELNQMWFQNGTTSERAKYRSDKYLPYAYTEQGISMLAGVLKNVLQ